MIGPGHQVQARRHGDGAAIGALECRRQRLALARENERERLETVDRPLEIQAVDEPLRVLDRHERRGVLAGSGLMETDSERAEPGVQIGAAKAREITQRAQAPAFEDSEGICEIRPKAQGPRPR